jgi:LPS O-antigen subunit length determinant protein (WzzB/FepE family)
LFSQFLLEIITSAGVSVLLTSLLIYLSKTWISERLKNSIKNEYDQKLETHKAQLKAQTDIEIEKLKSSLSIAAAERQVKFTRLHIDRAAYIAEAYAHLKNVYLSFQDYVKIFEPTGDKPRDERRKIAVDAHNAFNQYYTRKIIYLPKITAEKLEAINTELVKTFNEFSFTVDFQNNKNNTNKWLEIFEKMNNEIVQALRDLEDEFRKLLGDEAIPG